MFRYRCPHCSVVLQAPDIRAGKTTVCSKCSHPLSIPADKRYWLDEKGEPLLGSPTVAIPLSSTAPPPPPPPFRPPAHAEIELPANGDNDVLGAIAEGDSAPPSDPGSVELNAVDAPPEPTNPDPEPHNVPLPTFSRSLPDPDPDDGRVELYPPMPASETPVPSSKDPTPPPRAIPRRPIPAPLNPKSTIPLPRVPAPTPQPAWNAASSQSGSRPRRQAEPGGAIALEEPLRLRTEVDIAADLTSALASRMKPPPRPPRDLKPSTAVWILTSGIAVALLAASLITSNNFFEAVFTIGTAQVLAGYAWVTALAFRRDVRRGIACAIPPVTFWYLTNWKYAKYRPLRFAISGAALIGLALLAPQLQSQTRGWAGVDDSQAPIAAPEPIASQPKLAQLRYYRDQRQHDALIALLRTLARTDSIYSEDAKNRIEISVELKALAKHGDSGVRIEALAAYATWGGPDARELSLEASRSQIREERMMALRLLPRWKDEDVARRIAEMIKGRGDRESAAASEALIALGGPIAERAAIPLLRKDEQDIRLEAMEVLGNENVGGADAIAALKDVMRTSSDPGTRQRAEAKSLLIQERVNK